MANAHLVNLARIVLLVGVALPIFELIALAHEARLIHVKAYVKP
jgi:hypothetical protein